MKRLPYDIICGLRELAPVGCSISIVRTPNPEKNKADL